MIMLRVGIQLKPPLLQTYILPSGPSAAPLGPPGISATVSLRPSGQTRVSRRPRISTSTTEPSGMTTGPSGNSRPVARTRTLDIKSSRLLAAGGSPRSRTRNMLFADVMAKSSGIANPRRRATGITGRTSAASRRNASELCRKPSRLERSRAPITSQARSPDRATRNPGHRLLACPYSFTGSQISSPPLPVAGSKVSP